MSDAKSTTEHNGMSRRTVVRTAAHAAWAVPAIQIAVAAPAFASSAVKDIVDPLVVLTPLAPAQVGYYRAEAMSVINDGPGTLAAGTIRLTISVNGNAAARNWTQRAIAGPWSIVSGADTNSIVFQYNAEVSPGGRQSLSGSVTVSKADDNGTEVATLTYVGPTK